jgi:signal transduction histidine kinase
VVENLVSNSLRAVAANAGEMHAGDVLIEVGTFQHRGRIVVTDRGSGISKEAQGRVFEPFFTTRPGRAHGMGLAFCKAVIARAAGTIQLESSDLGTRVSIDVPALG